MLVTGATGFVGNNVVRALVRAGHRVRALARLHSPVWVLQSLPVEVVYGDLRDPLSIRRAMEGCEAVVHTAALYSFWERDPRLYYEVNVEGTVNVLRSARAEGVSRVVYTSTVGCMGAPPPGRLATEEDYPTPGELNNHYRRSKFLAEREALRLCVEEGVPVVVVNPTTPIGPWDVKPTPTGMLVLRFLRGRMPAYVEVGLNFVDVEDVAQGHLLALERGQPGQRYLLGGENLRLGQFLSLVAEVAGRRPPRLRLPLGLAQALARMDTFVEGALFRRPPLMPAEALAHARADMWVDCTKAREALGYRPGPVRAAVEKAVRWFRAHGYC